MNMTYLFAAYTVVWLVLFAYILFISGQQRNLDRKLDELRRMFEDRDR